MASNTYWTFLILYGIIIMYSQNSAGDMDLLSQSLSPIRINIPPKANAPSLYSAHYVSY